MDNELWQEGPFVISATQGPCELRFEDPSRELCRIKVDGTVHAGEEQIAAVLEFLIASRHEPPSEDLARRLIETALRPLAPCLFGGLG